MEFSWSKDQQIFRESIVKFASQKLNESIIQRDKDYKFSLENWKKCAEFGILNLPIASKYGGSGMDILTTACLFEGLGYGCKDNGLIFSINAHLCGCAIPIFHFGNTEQKKKYLPKLGKGELIGSLAITEPDSGCDVFNLKATARKEKDYYVLDGTKTFVTNAPVANIILVFATTDTTKGMKGICCFLVEKGTGGLTVGKNIEKSGLRTSLIAELSFDNCKIPKCNILGKESSGVAIFNNSMDWERICIMAFVVGAMDRQIEGCVKYANVRKQFGKPIGKFQAIAHKIVDMKVRLETGRLMLYKAAWLKKTGKSSFLETSIAKLFLSEAYIKNSLDAIQIHGGYGYTVEMELERELRDAIASTIYSGTTEMQKNIISSLIGL
jgi:hypothetical protein